MDIIGSIIDNFEKRIFDLEKIRCIEILPQWTDIDVISAKCLIQQYRNLITHSSRAAGACVKCGMEYPYHTSVCVHSTDSNKPPPV